MQNRTKIEIIVSKTLHGLRIEESTILQTPRNSAKWANIGKVIKCTRIKVIGHKSSVI